MSLDHGYLNLPLSKRGNIDREIDAYKANQRDLQLASEKAARAEWKAASAEAVMQVGLLCDERLIEIGRAYKLTAKQARKQLLAIAKTNPKALLASLVGVGGAK